MRLWEKIISTLGFDYEDYEEEGAVEQGKRPESAVRSRRNNVVPIQNKRQMKVVVFQPVNFEQVKMVSDHLKNNRTVIVNMEETPKEDAQRIIDFVSGAIYTINGGIQKVSHNIFLLTPANVEVNSDTLEKIYSQGMFPWIKSN